MSVVLASAADSRYGAYLLNMLGSVRANSDIFDRIVVYDLGLDPLQQRLASAIRTVELRTIPPFVPHWLQGRTWKTWIWAHLDASVLVWLDAGLTVLRPLDDLAREARERGYFVVAQGHPVKDSIPSDYYDRYRLPATFGREVSVAAGILAFGTESAFYREVIVPTYEDAAAGLSLGASFHELERFDFGIDRMEEPIVRDCRLFRHEQTLLNIHLYRWNPHPVVHAMEMYAGNRSPRDHPEQVIWAHRRRGDFRYLTRVPYRLRELPRGLAWGTWFYARAWFRLHRWLFRPSLYTGKARRLLRRDR